MRQLLFLLLVCSSGFAQKINKSEKKTFEAFKSNLEFLASDELQGRRAGTQGEKIAADFIVQKFKELGLEPAFPSGSFLQPFEISKTKDYQHQTSMVVDGDTLLAERDFFPLAFSATGTFNSMASMPLQEAGDFWFLNIDETLEQQENNPHFNIYDFIQESARAAKGKGSNGLLLFNGGSRKDEVIFKTKEQSPEMDIPIVFLTKPGIAAYFKDSFATYDIQLNISFSTQQRFGNNVAALLNQGAANWVVLGAHYDHLGYGEDHNSRYTGTDSAVHNGADDNASGTAAMLAVAEMIKNSGIKNHNFLFVAFSGEELGLFGSKYFVDHTPVELSKMDFMINMDMVGRLNDSSHLLTIGGYGTSPQWSGLLEDHGKFLQLRFDSSGTGPSDHTSFYKKDIPVLFLFTGLHQDYHKPSDDAHLVNYSGSWEIIKLVYGVLQKTEKTDKLAFTKTREVSNNTTASFKVTLGIMPDYTFSGTGVKADGVSAGKPAEKAGLKAGDIILSLGGHKVEDMQSYMEALGKFKKGDEVHVEIKRGNELLQPIVVF